PLRLFTTSHANDRALPSFPTRRSSDLGGVRAVPDPRRPGHDAGPGRAAARIRRTAPDEDRGAVQALLRNRRLSVTPVTPAAAPVAGWRPLVRCPLASGRGAGDSLRVRRGGQGMRAQRTQAPTRHARRGFTLIELLVTLAVASMLVVVAVPNFQAFVNSSRLAGAANEMIASLQLARAEAIRRN